MKKNIEWLKIEVNKLPLWLLGFSMLKQREEYAVNKDDVLELINQLDEKEVLSQDWVKAHEQQVHPDHPSNAWWVPSDDLQDLLVPRKELPIIPQFVADWMKENHGYNIYGALSAVDKERHSQVHDWVFVKGGINDFTRAWLDGFTIANEEEEQKYYVDLKTAAYVAKWDGNDQVDIYTDGISGSDEFEFHLTKKEIEGFDKRYLAFAIPVDGIDSALSDIENGRINTYKSFDELLKELEE